MRDWVAGWRWAPEVPPRHPDEAPRHEEEQCTPNKKKNELEFHEHSIWETVARLCVPVVFWDLLYGSGMQLPHRSATVVSWRLGRYVDIGCFSFLGYAAAAPERYCG